MSDCRAKKAHPDPKSGFGSGWPPNGVLAAKSGPKVRIRVRIARLTVEYEPGHPTGSPPIHLMPPPHTKLPGRRRSFAPIPSGQGDSNGAGQRARQFPVRRRTRTTSHDHAFAATANLPARPRKDLPEA